MKKLLVLALFLLPSFAHAADLQPEDNPHVSGQIGSFILGVRNDLGATNFTSTNGDYSPIAVDINGNIGIGSVGVGATSLGKNEDNVHASSDTGIAVWSVRSDVPASTAGSNGDYAAFLTGAQGQQYTQDIGGTANGLTLSYTVSAGTNNSTSVKGTPGQVYKVIACAGTAAAGIVKLYNKATAPTCGTDTPVAALSLPATLGACVDMPIPVGAAFSLGIGFCMVTGPANTDNTAVALNQILLTIGYK